jgi:flagellar hook assembly protein FlgD/outer membrane protein OmpA-like peptidoglycan-associated protein
MAYRIFSPNGDGNKDVLPIGETTSREDEWSGEIQDSGGNVVRSYTWESNPPAELVWDGTDETGDVLPDGIYAYRLYTTDRAGNSGAATLDDIGINTRPTPVSLSLSRAAFSPNSDGSADTVTFSPLFTTEGLEGWTLEVTNEAGRRVRSVEGTRTGVFEWDGRDDDGIAVPDGRYEVEFRAVYENGNSPRVTAGPLTVDTVYPAVALSSDYLLFSPDRDGRRDTITIGQRDASSEAQWTGEIRDSAARVVLRRQWTGRPRDVAWDGVDGQGRPVPDGTYSYVVQTRDEAGNAFSATLAGIRIDTRPTPVALTFSPSAFSPNGDGVMDTITVTPRLGLNEGVTSWQMRIAHTAGRGARDFAGTDVRPVVWDGLTDGGDRAPDGEYTAEILVSYEKGNQPVARTDRFVLDNTAPSVSLSADYTLFSPNGDGRRDNVTLQVAAASQEAQWTGRIVDSTGKVVKNYSWQAVPPAVRWDGTDDSRRALPDGEYRYIVSSTDQAGNTGSAEIDGIRIDTRPTPVSVRVSGLAFSPNGDGVKDTVTIVPEVQQPEGIDRWEIRITDRTGAVVRTARSTTRTAPFVWDGRNDSAVRVPDGPYSVFFEVWYTAGANPRAPAGPVTVDTVAPTVRLAADYLWFSPDGDGRRDTVIVRQSEASPEDEWVGTVLNARGGEVRRFTWKGRPQDLSWNGQDGTARTAADGQYTYRITSTDRAGNATTADVAGIRLDTRPTPVRLVPAASGFSPNADGVKDTVSFSVYAGLAEGIRTWTVEASAAAGGARIPIARGSGAPPASVSWDGSAAPGRRAAEGSYYAVLAVDYEKGNLAEERSAPFLLDVSPPQMAISFAPLPFSPDGDGVNDEVTLQLEASDASPIQDWQARILDPAGNVFVDFSGSGAPRRSIVWDGKAPSGELVQAASDYPVVYRVSDVLGNSASVRRNLPVDVYVIREGDRLRIQISSIYFAPFSAEFEPGKEEDNWRTLRRLAEILQRFEQYQIAIEGHAVRIYWFDEQRGRAEEQDVLKPLSLARSETVKKALAGLGVAEGRMTTVGLGGERPVVPHSDLDNRWKNRRVEFILRRP